jgi:hypothetical protein
VWVQFESKYEQSFFFSRCGCNLKISMSKL